MTDPTAYAGDLARHASRAHEALRALVHTTLSTTYAAPDVYTVLGSLKQLGPSLAKSCDQLSTSLHRSLGIHDVYEDDGGDPARTTAVATHHLETAASLARLVGVHLSRAQTAIARQGYRDDEPTTDQWSRPDRPTLKTTTDRRARS